MRYDTFSTVAYFITRKLGEPTAADKGEVVGRTHHLHKPNTGAEV